MKNLSTYKILLGSKSPRRSELLSKAEIQFEKRIIEVEEIFPAEMEAKDVPAFLAELKSSAFDNSLQDNEMVICADTIVIQDNEVIGKPRDKEHAVQTLNRLSANWHTVITGVCIKTKNKKETFSVRSDVEFYTLSADEIEFYIEKFQPYDKAGAYGIQDWIGVNKIKEIKGSYSNIMGLPMGRVYKVLSEW